MADLRKIVIGHTGYTLPIAFIEQLRCDLPDAEVIVCDDQASLRDALPGAQLLIGGRLTPELLPIAADLRWIHSLGTGVDAVLFPELVESDIVVTNLSGVDVYNIPEHILAMMFAFARDLLRLARGQVGHRWMHAQVNVFELGGQTLGIVGLGEIGRALAWRANALGMRVVGLRRHATPPPPGVDTVFTPDRLYELLSMSDHVAACVPLTPRTRRLFGEPEFSAMKPTAYFYNVGRGQVVDQDALVAALRGGQIAGAGLDVVTPEPLPDDSPLWDMSNAWITGHTAVYSPFYTERGLAVLKANIERFLRDEPLSNVVDKREGY